MLMNRAECVRTAKMDKLNDLQYHRGSTDGFRNKPENVSRMCESITRTRYKWTCDKGPIGYTPSRRNWTLHPSLKRKFLAVNYRFTDEGRKVRIV